MGGCAENSNFVKYSEETRLQAVKIRQDLILDPVNQKFLKVVYDLTNGHLSLKKTTTDKAMSLIFAAKATEWKLKPEQRDEYTEAMSLRSRNICRALQQALIKEASWTEALDFIKHSHSTTGSVKRKPSCMQVGDHDSQPKKAATSCEYYYGYDRDLRTAWRKVANLPKSMPELCVCLYGPEGAASTDHPIARFADDEEKVITDITIADLPSKTAAAAAASSGSSKSDGPPSWEGQSSNGSKVRAVIRTDPKTGTKGMLFEQTKQLCQALVKYFGDEDSRKPQQKAIDILTEIGQKYLNNEINKTDGSLQALKTKLVNAAMQDFIKSNASPWAPEPGHGSRGPRAPPHSAINSAHVNGGVQQPGQGAGPEEAGRWRRRSGTHAGSQAGSQAGSHTGRHAGSQADHHAGSRVRSAAAGCARPQAAGARSPPPT